MTTPIGFDSKCEDLAEHFLSEEPHTDRDVFDLAQAIQDAVETWFFGREGHAQVIAIMTEEER